MKKTLFIFPLLLAGCISSGPQQQAPSDYLLADSIHFDHAVVDDLRKVTSAKFERLVTTIEVIDIINSRHEVTTLKPDALEFAADDKTMKLLSGVRDDLKKRGYLVFTSEENFGDVKNKIGVLKSTDQFDILKCQATDGINYDIETDSVIKKLREWNERYPFEITGADRDWVSAKFIEAPADFHAFAKEVYAFCPDVVDQGTGTVEALAEEMKTGNWLYLWWD
ncbi:DUF4253 domain-containing protein [Chitinophaga sp. GCM10012297]|uniref:DUF4253 domain-containing protein n=1 Tax=Chitinophaga chungangae TaxID=2821488 RepID=A0ABS3YK86_9BACT|nr:DUF4253 domain-containing protein [Chitinophaga chungangae]MBO9155074.1 DUF4253 domain-containing protein [Chitinophaga chungangae]